MGLLSFFNKRKDTAPAPTAAAEAVAQARTKARQRLIGAVVLLGAGVIGFSLLFETQPRPIPVNIPIEIPRKDGIPPLTMPAARATAKADGAGSSPKSDIITETTEEAPAVAGSSINAKAAADAAQVKGRVPSPQESAGSTAVAGKAAAASKPATSTAPAASDGRFIVQVGAFSETSAARETRAKVEKLGLKTYTQVVETPAGKRIRVRVGPFASREQAAQVADKIKAAGLPSSVLTL